MATREEKAAVATALKKRLAEAKKNREAKKAAKQDADKGNGQTGAAPTAAKPRKKVTVKATGKKAKTKKAATKTKAAKKTTKAVKPAKKKAATKKRTAKRAQPTKKAKKTTNIKPRKGLAAMVESPIKDKKTNLTKFQVALVKLVENNKEGIGIKDLIRHVYTDEEVSEARKQRTATGTILEIDRPIRNAIRKPKDYGLIQLDKKTRLYHFVKWAKIK